MHLAASRSSVIGVLLPAGPDRTTSSGAVTAAGREAARSSGPTGWSVRTVFGRAATRVQTASLDGRDAHGAAQTEDAGPALHDRPPVLTLGQGPSRPPETVLCLVRRGAVTVAALRSSGTAGSAVPLVVEEGGAFVVDAHGPVPLAPLTGLCELLLLRIGHPCLFRNDAPADRATGTPLPVPGSEEPLDVTRTATAALLTPLLLALAARRPESASQLASDRLACHLADLLATLLAEVEERALTDAGRESAVRPGDRRLLADIRWWVNHHLGDPGLRPEAVAAAHYVSVRRLHKLFEHEGGTVSRWIQQRRLEECRRELGRSDRTEMKVSAVAQRWGFASPAHFSRAFRIAYGLSPRVWRELRTGVVL
ncbi:helix-turn-helix transcriptional regulator [Streptomyces sp. NBC_00234]|uniref:helix-turn-helix transcriptional regulator n=1 Tax=Streptomyces sp. NBC_00234 TaxID=2903638 RepID=UPI002E2AA05D|nr:helix-turn-helix transcriptional regulator [Streptomyces sp. NBC_00234]